MPAEQNERAKLNLNFDDEPVSPTRAEIDEKVREISEQSGFVSTAPAVKSQPSAPKPRRTRAKTGRTYPFNTKIKPETYDMICHLADTASEEEGRPVSLAEIIERSISRYSTS